MSSTIFPIKNCRIFSCGNFHDLEIFGKNTGGVYACTSREYCVSTGIPVCGLALNCTLLFCDIILQIAKRFLHV